MAGVYRPGGRLITAIERVCLASGPRSPIHLPKPDANDMPWVARRMAC